MNAIQFTPGPWSCDYGDFSVFCATGAEVARVTRGNHDDGAAISDGEMELNMQLVAAAPELLAALKIAVRALQDHDVDEAMAGEFETLTDAIAKAEGRA
jgi:hypothetical protein